MGIHDNECIAIPGFAGFVPSMSSKFGSTFGNTTREILKTDPSLKKGAIQQEFAKKLAEKLNKNTSVQPNAAETEKRTRNAFATGDDRFSFPPVPGYTG
jgi:hypothetical protein